MKVFCSFPIFGLILVSITCGLRYAQAKDEKDEFIPKEDKIPIQQPTFNLGDTDLPQPIPHEKVEEKDKPVELKEMK